MADANQPGGLGRRPPGDYNRPVDRIWNGRGEVIDREDLLDGRVRIELAGAAGEATIEAGFGWRRARREVHLEAADSYLTLIEGGSEFHASGLDGTVRIDPDTAAARIEAVFLIDDAQGDLASPGRTARASIEVREEEWSGEVTLAR